MSTYTQAAARSYGIRSWPLSSLVRALIAISAWAVAAIALLPIPGIAAPAGAGAAETRYVELDGERIAYRRIGGGSTIILTNRLRGTLDTWDPLFLDALATRHTVITLDYPGVGYSSGSMPTDIGVIAELIVRFAAEIGVERFAVLGWSWGGLVAQALLLDNPAIVTHGILVGTNPAAPNAIPMQQVFIERAFKPVNDLADEEILFFEPASAFSRKAAKASHARIYARKGVTEKIPSSAAAIQAYLTAAEDFHRDKAGRRTALATTSTPLLIISGDNDPATPGQNWYPLVDTMVNAQLLMFANAGHGPQHQYPALTADYIATFLARIAR